VGLVGISYGGWLTVMGMLEPHPALKAVSEQASPADMFLGDDFHHNGAFRLSYGFEYSAMMETGKTNFKFYFDRFDTYEWYLRLGALSNVNKNYLHGTLPTWNDFVAHPNYDAFWKQQAMPYLLTKPKVPNLNVAGWWDQEDAYGPMKIYEILEKNDPDHLNYLVAGP
jgi:predicted acyl esterase